MNRTPPKVAECWYRPYFFVDGDLRVYGWPEATARALKLPAERAIGRHCWELLGGSGCAGRCCEGDESGVHTCARVPLQTDNSSWIVWSDTQRIACGPPGSSMLEALLVRGVLEQTAHRLDLHTTLERIRQACGADDCELFLLEARRGEVALCDCAGADRDAFLEQTRMPLGYGYPGTVTLTCQPLFTDHVQDDVRFLRNAVKRRGIQTFIGVPVLEGNRSIGYLGVGWKNASIPLLWGLQLLQALQSLALAAAGRSAPPVTAIAPACALRCFGSLELGHGAGRLAQDAFSRRKSLDLLCHLLLAQGAPMQRDVLIELLWPEAPWRAGANRLHVTLNALRQTLARALPDRGAALVKQRHGYYRLDIARLGPIDAFVFTDGIDAARTQLRRGNIPDAISALEQVLPLYRGELFADAEDLEFEAPRHRYRLRYREALSLLINLYLRQGRIEAAFAALADARERIQVEHELHDSLLQELAIHQDKTPLPPSPGTSHQG